MGYSIPLFRPNFGEPEVTAVSEVIQSGWISSGPKTQELERAFAERNRVKHAISVCSGTAALHIALSLLAGPGDEVLVPSLTFVATVNAIRYVGALPVFVDVVGRHDLTISAEHARSRLTGRTRGIVCMHYAGFPCEMAQLRTLARERGLFLIEDAAHAPNTILGGRFLGTIGDIGCYSFFSNKNMTCAEGGMLLTDTDDFAERAKLMRSHGMTSMSYDRALGHATAYDVVGLGYNYRLDDMRAAFALAQFARLEQDAALRALLRSRYVEHLDGLRDVTVPFRSVRLQRSSNYIMPVLLERGGAARRDEVRRHMASKGVQTSVHYPAVHRFTAYSRTTDPLPHTEFAADHEITLPFYGSMTEEEVDAVVSALREAVRRSE